MNKETMFSNKGRVTKCEIQYSKFVSYDIDKKCQFTVIIIPFQIQCSPHTSTYAQTQIYQLKLDYKQQPKMLQVQPQQRQQRQQRDPLLKLSYKLINSKYILGPRFQKGGYASVFYAEDVNRNKYAIKVSNLKLISGKSQDRRQKILKGLLLEDQMMMACQSKYTIKCIQSFKDEQKELKFIVMELCEFGSLSDLIYLKGYLEQIQAKAMLKHILCGLSQIHKHGLLHRDIKSENVCFKQKRCILCDFGCSKQFLNQNQLFSENSQWYVRSNRKQGTIAGTNVSKSPEMLNGEQYGFKTDIWAVGILYYQMLTGVTPFMLDSIKSDKDTYQYIRDNIQYIYQPEYIRQNFKKIGLEKRGNDMLSTQAKEFLKKMIKFNQNQRFKWRDLINEKYLIDDSKVQFDWKTANCIIPIEQVSKQEFLSNIEKASKKQQQIKKIQAPIPTNQQKRIKIQSISTDIRDQIKQRANLILRNQDIIYNNVKIFHFEIRRLNLLMQFRGNLTQNKLIRELKCDKVGLLVSMYCLLKARQLEQQVKTKQIGYLKQKYNIQSLVKLIQKIYQSDMSAFKQDHKDSILSQIKNILSYDSSKKQFYNKMFKQQLNVSTVYKYIEQQVGKLYTLIKQQLYDNYDNDNDKDKDGRKNSKKDKKQKQIKDIQFYQQSKRILQARYQPNEKEGQWRQWHDFGEIVEYLNSRDNIDDIDNKNKKDEAMGNSNVNTGMVGTKVSNKK